MRRQLPTKIKMYFDWLLDILNQYLNSPKRLSIDVPPLSENFKPRLDEWAAWVDDQFKFSNIAFRFFYRLARKIRRNLSFM